MENDHIIHRQKLHIRLHDQDQMFRVRELAHRELEEKILPGLDALFSELAPAADDTVYHMQRLEVDLGRLSFAAFEQEFSERLMQQVRIRISDVLAAGDGVTAVKPTAAVLPDALLHYLHYGFIPWWFKPGEKDAKTLFKEELAGQGQLLELLAQLTDNSSRRRLLQLLGADFMPMLQATVKQHLAFFQDELELLTKLESELSALLREGEAAFQEALLLTVQAFIGQGNRERSSGSFLFRFLQVLASQQGAAPEQVQQKLARLYGQQAGKGEQELLSKAFARLQQKQNSTGAAALPPDVTAAQKQPPAVAATGFFVDNAGLVLLHPFLPQLFGSLSLTNEKGQFTNTASARKAAVVLHYLVKGEVAEVHEYDLVLNKILCGLPVDELLNPEEYLLSAAEKAACEELLAAVVAHWEVLKKTSNSGLREGFLRRNGKVKQDGNTLHLHVERLTQDVLLEKLPWGLSIIKFPFLNLILYVEW